MVGRSYGGGILKIEPREADRWAMPSPRLVQERAEHLRAVKPAVSRLLRAGRLRDAVALVDDALLIHAELVSAGDLQQVRDAQAALSGRRAARGEIGRAHV